MFFKHLLEGLLNPLVILLCLFLGLIIWLFRLKNTRKLAWFALFLFLLFLIFSTGWFPRWLTTSLEKKYEVVTTVDPNIRWIVVFSGGQASASEKKPTNMLLFSASIKRLIEGVRLYRALPHAKFLLSGGSHSKGLSEARQLAILLQWFNIPAKDIVLEEKSRNTADEAREIKQFVKDEPFYLVTSATHMWRSVALCKSQHLNPIPAPTDLTLFWKDERKEKIFLPNPQNLVALTTVLHEVLGMMWACIKEDSYIIFKRTSLK